MVFGDKDGGDLTRAVEVIAHEITHGVTNFTAKLPYQFQSGGLSEHFSDVFGSMVKQWVNNETADQADWLMGKGIYDENREAAWRSLKAPGTAYEVTLMGPDHSIDHITDYNETVDVHNSCGIPNKAFYMVSSKIGGHSWEIAGRIWYNALNDPALRCHAALLPNRKTCFQYFAELTAIHAARYIAQNADILDILRKSWLEVGIDIGRVLNGGPLIGCPVVVDGPVVGGSFVRNDPKD